MDQCWKMLAQRMEEEVLDKYNKVEESKRAPWNGGEYEENKRFRFGKWGEDCRAKIFSLIKELNLQRLQCNQEASTEEEEMKQQQRMMIFNNLTQKMRSEGRTGAKNRWWGSELLAADSEIAWIHTGWKILCRNGISGWRR